MVGLDSSLTPPPPLTSFLGCRSRMMASFRSFFSRRQTDRTTLTFGSGVFLLKQLPQFIWWQPFYRRVLVKASRKAVCVHNLLQISGLRPLPAFLSDQLPLELMPVRQGPGQFEFTPHRRDPCGFAFFHTSHSFHSLLITYFNKQRAQAVLVRFM